MSQQELSPGAQAAFVWSQALTYLYALPSLSNRDKSWFNDIYPEALFGGTIVLCITNPSTQDMLQSSLSEPLLEALRQATNQSIFPAFRLVTSTADSSIFPAVSKPSTQTLSVPTDTSEPRTYDDSNQHSASSLEDNNHDTSLATDQAETIRPSQDFVHNTTHNTDSDTSQTIAQHTTHNASHNPQQDSDQAFEYANVADQELQQTAASPDYSNAFNDLSAVRDPNTHLDKQATFDTFVPGESNRFARTVALAVAEGSGSDFNPLCIYGGSGLGKTHLLNAIGNYALRKDASLKVRYVTSEEFTNEFIEALQNPNQSQGQITEFNRRYREVDVLLIDDIQFLGGKEATLEQFFHTFNSLYTAGKRIVIASDVAPKKLKGFEERLISRFESGLTVDIKPPDLETRIAILRMIASMNNINVPNEVLDLIAERFTENIRELEGALTRVTALASLDNQPITKPLAEQTLQDFFNHDVEIKPTDIISQTANYFRLTFDDLVGRTRTKNVALARQVAMYLAREMTSMSLVDIGEVFGGRDHTTVMHACTKVSDEMQQKQELYNYVIDLTGLLKHQTMF